MCFIVVLRLLIAPLCKCFKARLNLYKATVNLNREKWKLARDRRKGWQETHWSDFDFNNPEYQKLWEVEIGAEDLYLLLQISPVTAVTGDAGASWSEYRLEREKYAQND